MRKQRSEVWALQHSDQTEVQRVSTRKCQVTDCGGTRDSRVAEEADKVDEEISGLEPKQRRKAFEPHIEHQESIDSNVSIKVGHGMRYLNTVRLA